VNVTIKLSDQLCRDALHRAADAGRSLSGWVEELIRRELGRPQPKVPQTLLEALGNEALSGIDIEFPRDRSAGVRA